ncbi:Imm53 family immunity protein [Victivallis sp. Marseille-Q1083]|uniref:Imm53 family immunity protein n=1 Tax=Victivallis sp. Marseille-Q1083 TaxID=2717288 RepID=UPI00158D7F29|nr:Imm53 family immunity protein [Victivallis sp. Marseille-Q1083]
MKNIVASLEYWNNYLYFRGLDNNTISIEAIENPGWWIKINLSNTDFENIRFVPIITNIDPENGGENNSENWLCCYIKDKIFNGCGSINKLSTIIEIFFNWIEEHGYDESKYVKVAIKKPPIPLEGFNIWSFCIKNKYIPIVDKY